MEARRDLNAKIVAKRRRKMSFKVVYILLLWRRTASRTSLLKKKKKKKKKEEEEEEEKMTVKRLAAKVAKLKAETNRMRKIQREVKEDLEDIGFEIAQKREKNKLVLEDDEHIQRKIDVTLDILDAQDQGDFVRVNTLTQNFRLVCPN